MINAIIFIVAVCLFIVLAPPSFIFALVHTHRSFKGYLMNVSIAIAQLGDVVCAPLLDLIRIKRGANDLFGNPYETISSVLGKNKEGGSLSWFGALVSKILNKIDRNHVEKSIEDNP